MELARVALHTLSEVCSIGKGKPLSSSERFTSAKLKSIFLAPLLCEPPRAVPRGAQVAYAGLRWPAPAPLDSNHLDLRVPY
eukprot:9502971-Pyramimonas_sp.AAC.2